MVNQNWPHDKSGTTGKLQVNAMFRLTAGRRLYLKEDKTTGKFPSPSSTSQNSVIRKFSGRKWRKAIPYKEFPSTLPVAKFTPHDVELTMSLDDPLSTNVDIAKTVVREVRTQVPPEIFDLSKIVCGTYLDPRLLVLRGVSGSALLFTRSCEWKSAVDKRFILFIGSVVPFDFVWYLLIKIFWLFLGKIDELNCVNAKLLITFKTSEYTIWNTHYMKLALIKVNRLIPKSLVHLCF